MPMTDEQLRMAALPLLRELIDRRMITALVRMSPKGIWVTSTIIGMETESFTLQVQVEDDAESIASATFL